MEFEKPQKFSARVSEKYFLTDNEKFLYIRFELVKPDRLKFLAGQYVSVKLGKSEERRSYSIATTPDNDHGFALVVEILPEGKGSQYLNKLKLGESVEILAPLGRFAVDQNQNKLLFVGTGSGIVPLCSMINDLLINKHESRQMRLHWGLKSEENTFWFDNFERLAEEHPNFVFDPVMSQPPEGWDLCNGHVQDCLRRDFSESKLVEWEGYICGNPKMVEDVAKLFEELGMKPENVHHEKYT
jgi:propane monooxygenase reductase subunit